MALVYHICYKWT